MVGTEIREYRVTH